MKPNIINLFSGLVLALSAFIYFSAAPVMAQNYCRDGFDGYGHHCREGWHDHRHRNAPIIIEEPAPVYIERPRWINCARENGFCRIPFATRVRYGAEGYFTFLDVDGRGIPCNNRAFGDPARGIRKACWFLSR